MIYCTLIGSNPCNCLCPNANTVACRTCTNGPFSKKVSDGTGGVNFPITYPPPQPKKITTEEYDKDGKLVKRVIEEGDGSGNIAINNDRALMSAFPQLKVDLGIKAYYRGNVICPQCGFTLEQLVLAKDDRRIKCINPGCGLNNIEFKQPKVLLMEHKKE